MKFWPTRSTAKIKHEPELIANLDALVDQPLFFKLHGKIHQINPINTIDFMKFANALAGVNALFSDKSITANDVVDRCFDLSSSVCKTIERGDIENMSQAQLGAFLQMLMDMVMGRTDEKKKTKL